MNKTGKFPVPHQEPGTLHLYRVEGSGVRKGFDPQGVEWNEFEVDLFAEEDSMTCRRCGKEGLTGWRCGASSEEICKGCVDVHTGPHDPCVLFHKFSRRCWSDSLPVKGGGWTAERELTRVYLDPKEAEEEKKAFLTVVQKAIIVVRLTDFEATLEEYKEVK